MSVVIRAAGLTKTYRGRRGVAGLDLEVEEGEVFGFLGPNGAGKTTTIRTLMGFLRPDGGRAEVFGFDVWRESVEVRLRVGNLPGELAFEDRMTGEQIIRLSARLRGVDDLSYARALAHRLGADLTRPVRRLSRGNRQKIGIVQAMFHRPPLLILDEPTGGLDPLVQEEFLRMIREVKEEGRTVFFSSHNLAEVERVCDRVGIIREGTLAAVEEVGRLPGRSFRRVRLTFDSPADPAPFAALPGVDELKQEGAVLSFRVHGDLDAVVKLAAGHTVVDIEVELPSLEEVFLAYYGEDGEER